MTKMEVTSTHGSDDIKNLNEMPKSNESKKDQAPIGGQQTTDQWLKIGDFTLTKFDKYVLESSKEWLTDTIINSAQHLLKCQFPAVKGLQNVLLNSLDEFETIAANDSFVQIINDEKLHWMVISNARVDNKNNECVIYDSRRRHQTEPLSDDVKTAIFKLMSADNIGVKLAFVTRQTDQHQCGLYAIAYSQLLCAGEDPSETLFTTSAHLLRKHLIECLTIGKISRFPTGSQTIIDTFII